MLVKTKITTHHSNIIDKVNKKLSPKNRSGENQSKKSKIMSLNPSQKALKTYYKMRQLYYESRQLFYYKLRLNFITKGVSYFITKRADFIAERGSFCKMRRFYYKTGQLLQNASIITKWGCTDVVHIFIF